MNALDFLITSDREYNRGICMWIPVGSKEWCAKPLTVENYRGSFNQPNNYDYGARYGIHVPEGMPEHESLWICNKHRLDFLKLNSQGNLGTTIWQFDHYGQGTDMTWVPMKEVSVRIRTHLDNEELSGLLENELNDLLDVRGDDIESWSYLKVVGT
jgi:hypothetical protein